MTVILPEYGPATVSDAALRHGTSTLIKREFFGEEGVVVTDVSYRPSFDEVVGPESTRHQGSHRG